MTCIGFAKNEEVQVLVLGQSLVELLQKRRKVNKKPGITEQLRFLKPSMGKLEIKINFAAFLGGAFQKD